MWLNALPMSAAMSVWVMKNTSDTVILCYTAVFTNFKRVCNDADFCSHQSLFYLLMDKILNKILTWHLPATTNHIVRWNEICVVVWIKNTELRTNNSQMKKSFSFSRIIECYAAIAAFIIFVLWTKVDCTRIAVNLYSISAVNCILVVIL